MMRVYERHISCALFSIFVFAFFILCITTVAAAVEFPKLTGRVVDEVGLLDPSEQERLAEKLEAHEKETGNQVVVVTVDSLQGRPMEDYGRELGNFWGIGQKGKNNGVLLIVAPHERMARIEVGDGLEAVLTNKRSQWIMDNVMVPAFAAGRFGAGIAAGVDEILHVLIQGKQINAE
jgi:uncharacterized protein